jgi:integrase
MAQGLIQRCGKWYLKRRVPRRFAGVEPRPEIWKSLKTDSLTAAKIKSEKIWLELVEGWEARLGGKTEDSTARFRAAQALADIRGFRFLSADEVAEQPLKEIVERVEVARDPEGRPDEIEASALLGAVDQPSLMLTEMVEMAETLAGYDNKFKNARQMRIWRGSRNRAVTNLMKAIGGDHPVMKLTGAHARKHKKFWKAKMLVDGTSAETANKDFNYISGMLKRIYEDLEIEDPPKPYAGVRIDDRYQKPKQKLEVPVDWIAERWLSPAAFEGLNEQARDILLISIETGCRQSEIIDLPAEAFKVDHALPHLLIANAAHSAATEGREIKNLHSERQVPLVGLALAAARRHPDGFPRYRGKAGYSALVNGYLRSRGLLPEEVTAGGLRHTWESRLKAAGQQVDDRGELMGHSIKKRRGREAYGNSLTLEERTRIVKQVAFPVPDHLA